MESFNKAWNGRFLTKKERIKYDWLSKADTQVVVEEKGSTVQL